MGTKGAFGFICDGKEKLYYNRYDSYPEEHGLGGRVADFVSHMNDVNGWEELKKKCTALKLVEQGKKPTAAQKKRYARYEDPNVNGAWYSLQHLLKNGQMLWETYAGYVKEIPEEKKLLFDCEHAYLLDLDNGNMHVYEPCGELIGSIPLEKMHSNWLRYQLPYYGAKRMIKEEFFKNSEDLAPLIGVPAEDLQDLSDKVGDMAFNDFKDLMEAEGFKDERLNGLFYESGSEKNVETLKEWYETIGGAL